MTDTETTQSLIVNLPFTEGSTIYSLPCVVVNGRVSTPILSWLLTQARDNATPASLERYARALGRFIEYYTNFGEDQRPEQVVQGFARALQLGCKELRWSPLASDSAKNYFNAFNQFCDWLVVTGGYDTIQHPNPTITVSMTPAEQAAAEARSRESSMLHHLYSLTKSGQGIRTIRKVGVNTRFSRRTAAGASLAQPGKTAGYRPLGMSLEDYWKLLTTEKNPRNRLLWLLLGAGGCRVSETLNMFQTDIHYQASTQQALVALANPVEGISYLADGRRVPRHEYLKEIYGLTPRCLLSKSDPLHAGWKGIAEGGLHDDNLAEVEEWADNRWTLIEWLMPIFGRLFWKSHLTYMQELRGMRLTHPYYLVNLQHNIGSPLTRSAVNQLLAVACKRAGVKHTRPHRLRHMYGTCLADWGIPLPTAQTMMRHMSPLSTLVYFKVSRKVVHQMLKEAQRFTVKERQEMLQEQQQQLLPKTIENLLEKTDVIE
jgi:site-specific recombinase XerD